MQRQSAASGREPAANEAAERTSEEAARIRANARVPCLKPDSRRKLESMPLPLEACCESGGMRSSMIRSAAALRRGKRRMNESQSCQGSRGDGETEGHTAASTVKKEGRRAEQQMKRRDRRESLPDCRRIAESCDDAMSSAARLSGSEPEPVS